MICRFASIMTLALICTAPALAVTNPVQGQVALYRGSERSTYSCAETCDELPRVGDDPARVPLLSDQQSGRLAIAESAIGDPS